VDVVKAIVMTATATSPLKDPKLLSFGLVESASVNSFADFIPSKFNESQIKTEQETTKEKEDFKNTFICHLIFYTVLIVSIVLHILIDLGLGSFLKNKFVQLMAFGKKTILDKSPAFA
jgi:cytochrome b